MVFVLLGKPGKSFLNIMSTIIFLLIKICQPVGGGSELSNNLSTPHMKHTFPFYVLVLDSIYYSRSSVITTDSIARENFINFPGCYFFEEQLVLLHQTINEP